MSSPAEMHPAARAVDDELLRCVDAALAGDTVADAPLPTGLTSLDEALDGGLRPGQVTVVTGAPGVGKSVFALGIARHSALRTGLPTLVVAPDSPQYEILCRLIAAEAPVPLQRLRSGRLTDADKERVQEVRATLSRARLAVSAGWQATRSVALGDVVADYADGLRVVVVDASATDSHLVRELKLLALERDLAVVMTASRPVADSSDRVAPNDDLRGIESVADLVIDLARDDYANDASVRAGEADLRIVKHRYGPIRQLPAITFQATYGRFMEMTR